MKHLRRKTLLAALLTLILFIPSCFLLYRAGESLSVKRELERGEFIMEDVSRLIRVLDRDARNSMDWFQEDTDQLVHFMTSALKGFVSKNGYTGPPVTEDGVVVEVKGGKVIYPEEMPEGLISVTPQMIEETLASENTFMGLVEKYADENQKDNSGSEIDLENYLWLSVGKISGNFYYIDMKDATEVYEYWDSHVGKQQILELAESTYGGAFLSLSDDDETLTLKFRTTCFPDITSAKELGLTYKMVKDREETIINIFGEPYKCEYKEIKDSGEVLLYLNPLGTAASQNKIQLILVLFVMLLVCIFIATYILSVQHFVRDKILLKVQKAEYSPQKVRRKVIGTGILGVVTVFVAAVLFHSVALLYLETESGKNIPVILFGEMLEVQQKIDEDVQKEEESWYVFYGERMASLIAEYPLLGTPEKLQEYCEDLSIDYIMLFNSDGSQKACNLDYSGFRLGRGQGENSSDFERLLMGVPSIVHEPSMDSITGLEKQMIGVTMPAPAAGEMHGALIMALAPDQTGRTHGTHGAEEQSAYLQPKGTMCFAADAESGKILSAGNREIIGNTVTDLGFNEKSLQDGYMDFSGVGGEQYYTVTSEREGTVYYYCIKTSLLFDSVLSYGLLAGGLLLCIVAVLIFSLMKDYTNEIFERDAVVGEKVKIGDVIEVVSPDGRRHKMVDASRRWAFSVLKWEELSPEAKTQAVFKATLCTMSLLVIFMAIRVNSRYGNRFRLFSYIINGDWMRGLNIFAVCGTLILLVGTFLVLAVSKRVLQTLCDYLDSKGETICRLLYNLIQYFSVFVLIYLVFGYLGFPTSTVLASLGLVSLALSLGAKDVVSDILAGIAIVFEGEFQVGDIIEIDGYRGVVQEIGVRTTKVIGSGDNLKIISNSDIKNVINKTRLNSWYYQKVNISASESLERVEEILARELPEIAKRHPEIISGPEYKGVNTLGAVENFPYVPAVQLVIATECSEDDYFTVVRFMNREIRYLFERENIEIR